MDELLNQGIQYWMALKGALASALVLGGIGVGILGPGLKKQRQ